jgi:hypothetical protein
MAAAARSGFLYPKDGSNTFSKTSVYTISTRCHIPEDGILHSHCHENLKSYIVTVLFLWGALSDERTGLWNCFSQSQSHIATDGQLVKSWYRAPSGDHDQIFITVWQLRFCFLWGALSDERTEDYFLGMGWDLVHLLYWPLFGLLY